jgi:hypothetical protein
MVLCAQIYREGNSITLSCFCMLVADRAGVRAEIFGRKNLQMFRLRVVVLVPRRVDRPDA